MDSRLDIITTLNTLFWATDHHDWDTLTHVFSDQVTLDYGEPELLSPQEIIGRWRPVFEGLNAHQHLVSNHLITLRDDAATATASFIATHQHARGTWTLGGDYRFSLHNTPSGWKVTAMEMRPVWEEGVGF